MDLAFSSCKARALVIARAAKRMPPISAPAPEVEFGVAGTSHAVGGRTGLDVDVTLCGPRQIATYKSRICSQSLACYVGSSRRTNSKSGRVQ